MADKKMMVSIIIPAKEISAYLKEAIFYILNLNYRNFEILLLPDFESSEVFPKTIIFPTGRIGPAQKRNLALQHAAGEILAFLDDDAYPRGDWLKNAIEHFADINVAAVGGPAVTPENDNFWQKVSGAVFLSRISGGNPERYWPIGGIKEVDDWPSVNLLVRKSDFAAVNGFDCAFWPGEDTKLCLDLRKKLSKKIIYDSDVLVYHHRRAGLKNHLKQVGGYGLHRGYFAKKYPENSRKLKYFLPSLFLIFVAFGWLLVFLPLFFKQLYLGIWLIYGLALAIAFFDIKKKTKNIKVSLAALPYIFLTHLVYGWKFLQGFIFTKNLKSRLRK